MSLRLTNPSPSRENKESEGVSSKRALLDPPTSYPRGHRGHTARWFSARETLPKRLPMVNSRIRTNAPSPALRKTEPATSNSRRRDHALRARILLLLPRGIVSPEHGEHRKKKKVSSGHGGPVRCASFLRLTFFPCGRRASRVISAVTSRFTSSRRRTLLLTRHHVDTADYFSFAF